MTGSASAHYYPAFGVINGKFYVAGGYDGTQYTKVLEVYDPATNGHLDIIERASELFDEIVVTVMINKNKKGLFTIEERMEYRRANSAFEHVSKEVGECHLAGQDERHRAGEQSEQE